MKKLPLVSADLRKKFTAAWMKKGMAMLYQAKRLGFSDADCLNIDHLDFWIGMQELEGSPAALKDGNHNQEKEEHHANR